LEYTRLGIVNRQLQFRDGDPLSQGQLIESQRRLYDLGIFSQVEMAVQNPAGTEQERTVLVQLEEARRYTLRIGLGADIGRFGGSSGDATNIEGKTEISPNISFDVTRLNVGGRPHTASLRTRFSTLQKRAGLTYLAPSFLNHPWLNASATALFDETRDVRTFTAERLESSLQFESKLSRLSTLFSRYTFRRVTVDTSSLRISPDQIPLVSRPVLVGIVSQTWLRDSRDDPTDARRGMFSSVDFGVAAKQLGSETSFVRMVLQNSSYHPIGRGLSLARSFQFGAMSPFGKGRTVEVDGQPVVTREIPIAERFFAGGGNSHRGFAVNQAGPRDPLTGFAVGGNALLFHSLELRFPVWRENISGVLFHDLGNVFDRIRDLTLRQHQTHPQDFRYLVHAIGLGARYRTPVGPVRFDVGYNLNPTRVLLQTGTIETLSRWQFLVSIGQSF
jgi:outer membrane protein assembly factor BamA